MQQQKKCGGVIKPDIVMFGEDLPERFITMKKKDFENFGHGANDGCDAMLILGTSLLVAPFNNLVECPDWRAPRILINREKAGHERMYKRLKYEETTIHEAVQAK